MDSNYEDKMVVLKEVYIPEKMVFILIQLLIQYLT